MTLYALAGMAYALVFSAADIKDSPFKNRDTSKTQDWLVKHNGTLSNILQVGNESAQIYIVNATEPYFNWPPLVIKTTLPLLSKAKVGDEVTLPFKHTTGDIVLVNPSIMETFFDALVDGQEEYLGYLQHPAGIVDTINLRRVDSESTDIGPFSMYWVDITFTDGSMVTLWEKAGAVNIFDIAEEGDVVLIASGSSRKEFPENRNFGKKKVYQIHSSGPNNNELLYKKPSYGDTLFNLNKGTKHRFN